VEILLSTNAQNIRTGNSLSDLLYIFNSIKAINISENFANLSCDTKEEEIIKFLDGNKFDQAGLFNTKNKITHIATKSSTGRIDTKEIPFNDIISESTPLHEVANLLKANKFFLVLKNKDIFGIITRYDFQKIPARIYLFGLISLAEMHLTRLISSYNDDGWKKKINNKRLAKAEENRKSRCIGSLLENVQLCDKKEITIKTPELLSLLGLSKSQFENEMENFEHIRNNLAHSQNILSDNFDTIFNAIKTATNIIEKSEKTIRDLYTI